LFDGVIENLPVLHKKFKLGIVSGARKSEIYRINEFNGIQNYFEFIVATDDVMHSKPSPEGYLKGFEKMTALIPDLKKSEVLVVEDTHHGITAAKEAGLFVIGISTSHGLSVLKSFKPSMTVKDHQELFEHLRSL
jgi:beta-phosphoglucomutase